MTRVTMTSLYGELDNWPARIFEGDPVPTVTVRTSTAFSLTYPGNHGFPGFRVIIEGTGFTYLGGEPTGGTISRVSVLNASGQLVIRFDTISASSLAADFAQFTSDIFGSRFDGDGPSANGYAAWNHLLSGNDVINGTTGDDWRGTMGINVGNDVFNMLAGDDQIAGGIGNDTIYGGDGYDRITFWDTTYRDGDTAYRGINVNMATGVLVDCWGGVDRFTGIEQVTGSRFNDVFRGSEERDNFTGLRGVDIFYGGAAGSEDNNDEVRYESDFYVGGRRGIVVDLETSIVSGAIHGTIRDGFGQIDRVINVERVTGTRYDDVFVGSSARNLFAGGEGRDSYNGFGTVGFDIVDFGRNFTDQARVGINVNLSLATNQIINDGFGNTETAISIEEIRGSHLNDRIIMTSGNNRIEGRDGQDTMTGGAGADEFFWYQDSEFGDSDLITDFAAAGVNHDVLQFETVNFAGMTTTLRLVNGTAATTAGGTFVWNTINDTLYWDRDGAGGAAQVAVARLAGVGALTAANFDLF